MTTFTTVTDAYTAANGVLDWEWDNGMSFEGFAEYLYRNYDNDEKFNEALTGYITENGGNPADYSIGPKAQVSNV